MNETIQQQVDKAVAEGRRVQEAVQQITLKALTQGRLDLEEMRIDVRNERPSNVTETTMNLITLTHGPALQTIWARDSYAITAARMTFARAHGIAPDEVVVTMEYAVGILQQAPTAEELVIINGV